MDRTWVSHMAEHLVCEVADVMGHINLSCESPPIIEDLTNREMDVLCAVIGGDCTFDMQFFADRTLFCRFARNMIGAEPDEEDVQEYATEFFNVLCGRFVSGLVGGSGAKIKLMPIKYELPKVWSQPAEYAVGTQWLKFISDAQECAVFSWTPMPIEEMLRRNMAQ